MIELLQTLQNEPMYELDAINPGLSKHVRAVRTAKVRAGWWCPPRRSGLRA